MNCPKCGAAMVMAAYGYFRCPNNCPSATIEDYLNARQRKQRFAKPSKADFAHQLSELVEEYCDKAENIDAEFFMDGNGENREILTFEGFARWLKEYK